MDTKELETLDLLHYSPVDVNGDVFGPPFSVVHDQLLCLAHIEGEVVVLAPHYQFSDLLPIGRLIIVGDQAYHCCVVRKLNDGVGVMFGHAVVGEQAIQEGTKYTALRGPSLNKIFLELGSIFLNFHLIDVSKVNCLLLRPRSQDMQKWVALDRKHFAVSRKVKKSETITQLIWEAKFQRKNNQRSYNGKLWLLCNSSSQIAIPVASTICQQSLFNVSGLFLQKQARIMRLPVQNQSVGER